MHFVCLAEFGVSYSGNANKANAIELDLLPQKGRRLLGEARELTAKLSSGLSLKHVEDLP